ncbi:MAG: sigma-70 family RNA polymerase sigma factor [Bacteroidales bacterium]|nr:sigma-70 family RNA polymerase sigma factor [Bacteroidales bacterium]
MNKLNMLAKEQKFKQLVEENRERIRRICRYYAPAPEDQKDMYQEILMNIWKSLDKFRGEAAVSTWVYRISVNTALGFAGKELRRLKLNLGFDSERFLNILTDEEKSASSLTENQINGLQTALNQLSVVDKLLISLALEDLPTREIADIIGITETNTRVKIHRIKEQLKKQMKEYSHE